MHSKEPLYLHVPFYDEERAVFLGARFDEDRRQYYVPPRKDFLPFREWFKPRPHYRRRGDDPTED